jgi:hypothetical protein
MLNLCGSARRLRDARRSGILIRLRQNREFFEGAFANSSMCCQKKSGMIPALFHLSAVAPVVITVTVTMTMRLADPNGNAGLSAV